MGFSRKDTGGGLPCPPPGDLPNPGIKPVSLISPALAGCFFTTKETWVGGYLKDLQGELPECLISVRIPESGWLMNNRHLFLRVLEAGKSKIKVPADSVSGEGLLPGS